MLCLSDRVPSVASGKAMGGHESPPTGSLLPDVSATSAGGCILIGQTLAALLLALQVNAPYADTICQPHYTWDCETAQRIARCESGLDPWARGSLGEIGLFQLHPIHQARVGGDLSLLFDPEINTEIAHDLYVASGWGPWRACSR